MKKETISLRKVICKRFRVFRQQIGLTQKDLSRQLGVPIKNVSTIEVENHKNFQLLVNQPLVSKAGKSKA